MSPFIKPSLLSVSLILFLFACSGSGNRTDAQSSNIHPSSDIVVVKPVIITEEVLHDTDDPAIWIHPTDPSKSLILGTDKGGSTDQGGLYVFNLDGTIDRERSIVGLDRPNNVDIAYRFKSNSGPFDIAVVTVRRENSIRIFRLPDMVPVDNGGIKVFEGEELNSPMGIALYTDPATGDIYAIVGRKDGPSGSYLWQYKLEDSGSGYITGRVVRKFGEYSGLKEIEAIAVDNELGYVYYSDEMYGVRKYYAHPDSTNAELLLFATTNVTEDHEGISIYKRPDGTGYLILSDQQANRFNIYRREGNNEYIRSVNVAANSSDGSDITHVRLNDTFKNGIFVAMSEEKTFHIYRVEDILGDLL